jgi:hypothetical protein
MPRVTKQQRLVPLCDASAQCTSCGSLQAFVENERALELPMVLSKKGLAHVQQTVGWLVAPQGGSWPLQMETAAGEHTCTYTSDHVTGVQRRTLQHEKRWCWACEKLCTLCQCCCR